MTKEEIQRLVELSEKATQGEWDAEDGLGLGNTRLYARVGCLPSMDDYRFIAALVNWFRANHQSPSLESVRSEAVLDAPAQIGSTRFHAGVKWSAIIDRAQREWRYRNTPDPALTQMKTALTKAENQFDALQSPARVAEGGPVREALSNLDELDAAIDAALKETR